MKYFTISKPVLDQITTSLNLCREIARGSSIETIQDKPSYERFTATNDYSEAYARPDIFFCFDFLTVRTFIVRKSTGLYHIYCKGYAPKDLSSLDPKSDMDFVRNTYGVFPTLSEAMIAFDKLILEICGSYTKTQIKHYVQMDLPLW